MAGQPLWAKLFYLVRTGHAQEALDEAIKNQQAIEHREASFISHFRAWVESPERRLPKPHRDQLHTTYNAHMLHSATTDPFKLALFKLMGKIDPARRSVPQVTVTTEDWLWFQLSMVEEGENGGLRALSEVLLSYGERHFDGAPGQKGARRGVWAGVLLMCGQFERVRIFKLLTPPVCTNQRVNRPLPLFGSTPRQKSKLYIWPSRSHTTVC